jgi:hypothetical protein
VDLVDYRHGSDSDPGGPPQTLQLFLCPSNQTLTADLEELNLPDVFGDEEDEELMILQVCPVL